MLDRWIAGFTQNTAATSLDSVDPELRPLTLSVSKEEAIAAIRRWASHSSRWSVEQVLDAVAPPSASELHGSESSDAIPSSPPNAIVSLVRQSRVFRFRDDVQVSLRQRDDQTLELWMTSASRVGKGDLGQNARNLKSLRRGILSQLNP